jgi:hypothetical protein
MDLTLQSGSWSFAATAEGDQITPTGKCIQERLIQDLDTGQQGIDAG